MGDLAHAAREFLKSWPGSGYAGVAVYFSAKADMFAGRTEAARTMLEGWIQTREALRGPFPDDGPMRLGEIYAKEGRFDEAARAFERVVREYPDDSGLEEVAYLWGLALHDGGRMEEAKAVLTKALVSFPTSRLSARARRRVE
ncbi:MAG: tetratricopeptide repeat protein [Planctomycetes bacterium]|nr:tetratricopeptide repeat protein [Planctomycetota bacterium]